MTELPTPFAAVEPHRPNPWRSLGLWMTAALIAYILFNAVRSTLNPVGFASAYGVPLASGEGDTFVRVYAIRALFLGVFALTLLLRRQYAALAVFAAVGSVMPIGDAALVTARGGSVEPVVRHVGTALVLLSTALLVHRFALAARTGHGKHAVQ